MNHLRRSFFFVSLLFFFRSAFGQPCDCEKEFIYIKGFIEKNYAGFADKQQAMTKAGYQKMAARYLALARNKNANENCLLVISEYLNQFKDQHIQIGSKFDATKLDSAYIGQRRRVTVPESLLTRLQGSKTAEGIYVFQYDSSYRIAFYRDPTALHDYIGVLLDSKLPHWKRGMVKFEAKQVGDSMLKGILYMRNHQPKVEWFSLGRNTIGGDWQREGTKRETVNFTYEPVAAKQLSAKTLYLKIANFSPSNAKRIDSLFRTYDTVLKKTPYLVLDLRDNGGGSDFAYQPLLPYLYTNPVKSIGVDVWATESNINGWKVLLNDNDIPENTKNSIRVMIEKMEKNKGQLVNIVEDEIDSSFQATDYPKKVVVLVNEHCASTTEQFLLFARQSKKVVLAGQPTEGVLDYSNMREAPFSCMPYVLRYATTRSRRLAVHQGIDNTGIKPDVVLKKETDWIKAAQNLLETK